MHTRVVDPWVMAEEHSGAPVVSVRGTAPCDPALTFWTRVLWRGEDDPT
ncbi:hypothetical protein [Streptomyces sp. NBC_01369]